MLSVSLSVSIWWAMLALIPVAVLLLAVQALLPSSGAMHNAFERFNRAILFAPVAGAPQLSFIKFLLVALGIVASMVGLQVYNDSQKIAPAHLALDKQLLAQSKTFRNQRNLYLTLLALALWWMVYTVFTLKAQISRLIDAKNGGAAASSSSSRAAGAAGSHKKAAPVAVRHPPAPSAPPAEHSTNAGHEE